MLCRTVEVSTILSPLTGAAMGPQFTAEHNKAERIIYEQTNELRGWTAVLLRYNTNAV